MKFEPFDAPEARVDIPVDAAAWQLFTGVAGANKAAKSLTAALKRALRARDRNTAIKIMDEALTRFSEFGSSDTEPRAVAEQCLTKGRGGDYSWSL